MNDSITQAEYDQIRTLLYEKIGISLGENKQSLVISRLSKRLRELELDSFGGYYELVSQDSSGEEFTRRASFGMPKEALKLGGVDKLVALGDIASAVLTQVSRHS